VKTDLFAVGIRQTNIPWIIHL